MFKIFSGISKKILIISIILLVSSSMAIFIVPGRLMAEPEAYPIMRPSYAARIDQINEIENGPQSEVKSEAMGSSDTGIGSVSLLARMDYSPSARNQGQSGTCWVWAGTGVMEVAKNTLVSPNQRFSIQFFDSNYNGGTGSSWAGMGGTLSRLVDFYSNIKMAIPWSNTNAYFQDGSQSGSAGAKIPASAISTFPNYPITSITRVNIPAFGLDKAVAVSNIKSILNAGKAVVFSYWLPNATRWNEFYTFWGSGSGSTAYNFDSVNGEAYTSSGGGHSVLCVGYYEGATLSESYWIMLNSWGTTASRPDGIFRVAMDLNYTNKDSYNITNLTWETLDIAYGSQGTTVPVTSISVTGAGNATTVLNGATLKMSAAVLPSEATDKSIIWSVTAGTGSASIGSATGILSASGVGSVTVTAAANDGSGITGTKSITVTAAPAPAPGPAPGPGPGPGPASGVLEASPSAFGSSLSNYEETTAGFATLYYNRILNRGPDEEGLNGWVAVLDSGGLTGVDVVNCFFSSKECQAKISGYTNEQFLTFLYGIIFDRPPDAGGLAGWINNMAAGMTQAEVVNNFARSVEFETLCDYFGVNPYPGYSGLGK